MGVQSFGCGPDHTETYTTTDFIHQIDTSKQVRAVITSYDVHLSYPKVMKAANYIKQGAHFYATNEDATLPGPVPGQPDASFKTYQRSCIDDPLQYLDCRHPLV